MMVYLSKKQNKQTNKKAFFRIIKIPTQAKKNID